MGCMPAKGQKLELSDEEREKRRQRIMALNAEGRAGAEYGKLGGRPRKPRASETIAQKARDDAERLYEILKQNAEEAKRPADQIKAVDTILRIEREDRRDEEREEEKLDQLDRDELGVRLLEQLEQIRSRGIARRPDIIIDARSGEAVVEGRNTARNGDDHDRPALPAAVEPDEAEE
jgi:hypothetical protein